MLLGTEEGRQDPYLLYRALRDIAPLFRSELDGHWYASRYDDCKAILVDPRAGRGPGMVSRYGQNPALAQRFTRRMRMTMIMQNPPEHTRLRGVVSRAFTPRRVAGLEERIVALLEPMLDAMADAGEVDFMAALAFQLPVTVIGELVGVPEAEREQFRDLVRRVNRASEVGATTADLEDADRATEYQDAYFADLVARKRREPDDGLLSALIEIRDAGGPLSEEEMVATGRLLFGAGFVTTTNLIGNGMVTFFRHPGEMARFWADPQGLAATAVDEILRYESVVQTNGRWVHGADWSSATEKIDAGETSSRSSAGPTATRSGSPTRSASTWPAGARCRSASAGASTTASVPRWPGWRRRSSSPGWPSASPASSRRRRSPGSTPRSCGACPPLPVRVTPR